MKEKNEKPTDVAAQAQRPAQRRLRSVSCRERQRGGEMGREGFTGGTRTTGCSPSSAFATPQLWDLGGA